MTNQKGNVALIVLIGTLLLAVVGVGTYYLGTQNNKPETGQNEATPSLQITSIPDETADWKTYSSAKVSFKYPPTYVLTETDPSFITIRPNETIPAAYADTIIDARLQGNYADYDNAVAKTQEGLTNKTITQMENGTRITGEITEGIGGGRFVDTTLFKYQDGAIVIEYVAMSGNTPKETFNKILATVKVTQ